jgi:hypothetical protein
MFESSQVVMASSIGELVVATRRNFAKVDKLTQNPVALASLGFLAKQVRAVQNRVSGVSIDAHQFLVHCGVSKLTLGALGCATIFITPVLATSSQPGARDRLSPARAS